MSPRGARPFADRSFTAVADSAPGMMWIARPDGCRTFFNRTWLGFTGRTLAQESGAGWLDAVHPDDRSRCRSEYKRALRTTERFQLEYRLRRADGEFRAVLDRGVPRVDDDALVGFIGSCLDIQDWKGAALALRESETRFRLLAENAVDVIYRYRVYPTFGTEYISPAAEVVCGRKPEEFLANPELGFQLVHPDDRKIAMAMRHDTDALKGPTLLRWIHADGRIVWTEHRGAPILDDTGRLVAVEGIVRDVTDRVAAEQRLRTSQTQLRRLTAGIVKARENERTMIARELHDELGQSLTAIKLELARMSRTVTAQWRDPALIDNLQSIVGRIDVATETVRRLATWLRPPALDYLGLVAAIELEAASLARRTGIRCRVTGNRDLPPLDSAKTTAIFRVVQEALTNVGRHASASSVRITIQSSGAAVAVKVKDNGCGMNLEAVTGRHPLGILGMRERADMIGARLDIVSAPGKGTLVSMALNGHRRRRERTS
jgi:two-component system, NarL family, sensor histidine kinase UhpB